MVAGPIAWLLELQSCLNTATDGEIIKLEVLGTVNPLVREAYFHLSTSWEDNSFRPFSVLAHAFARANGCAIHRLWRDGNKLGMEVHTPRRLGQDRRVNPLTDSNPPRR